MNLRVSLAKELLMVMYMSCLTPSAAGTSPQVHVTMNCSTSSRMTVMWHLCFVLMSLPHEVQMIAPASGERICVGNLSHNRAN